MGVALKDLRGKVKRPVRSVSICLDGELWSKHDELTAQLENARQAAGPAKMGDSSEIRGLAQEIAAVEAEMHASEVTVQLRGISSYQLKAIQTRFPTDDPRAEWDVNEGGHALIAACAVEPTTEDEAKAFLEEAHMAVSRKLINAAWDATTGSDDVPFSARASVLIAASVSK